MTKEKPNLSDEIMYAKEEHWDNVIKVKDIKKAIKLFSEDFINDIERRNVRAAKTVIGQFNYFLKKRFGDDLISMKGGKNGRSNRKTN